MSSVTTTSESTTTLTPMQRFLFGAIGLVLAFTGAFLLSETVLRFFGDVPHSTGVAIGRIALGVIAIVFAIVCLNVLQRDTRRPSDQE